MNLSPRIRRTRTTRTVVALLSLAALTACGDQSADKAPAAAAAKASAPTTTFTENGVTVTLSVADWQASKGTLTAVFTPRRRASTCTAPNCRPPA